uniref:DUF885 domain-containing protein n=1 Tax=Parastrongyloides trichosuri TaxID=131310 RepID=A0A0N4ZZC3_PARTI
LAALMGAVVVLAACAAAQKPDADSLDAVAHDYVALTLEIGEREPGYVDAYYGPAEWAEAAKANPRALPQLAEGAASLSQRLDALPERGLDAQSRQRRAYLTAHVAAASARLRMLQGEKMGFADEAEALFGVRPELRPLSSYDPVLARIDALVPGRPELRPLSSYDPVLARIDALVPGEGPLAERVAAFRARYVIPKNRLDTVMRAAIAECKARTEQHMTLPPERPSPWSSLIQVNTDLPIYIDRAVDLGCHEGYPGHHVYNALLDLIQVNTDLPIYIDRAVDLGCHEGYPGHHVYNALLEQTFVKDKGWIEMSVYPLFSPMSFIAEGSATGLPRRLSRPPRLQRPAGTDLRQAEGLGRD